MHYCLNDLVDIGSPLEISRPRGRSVRYAAFNAAATLWRWRTQDLEENHIRGATGHKRIGGFTGSPQVSGAYILWDAKQEGSHRRFLPDWGKKTQRQVMSPWKGKSYLKSRGEMLRVGANRFFILCVYIPWNPKPNKEWSLEWSM